jgi:hypothetical protein
LLAHDFKLAVARSQYHLAVAGGYEVGRAELFWKFDEDFVPTRYREVVLTSCHYQLLISLQK